MTHSNVIECSLNELNRQITCPFDIHLHCHSPSLWRSLNNNFNRIPYLVDKDRETRAQHTCDENRRGVGRRDKLVGVCALATRD